MKGIEGFLSVFGNVTVAEVVMFVAACVFLYAMYKAAQDYLIKRHEKEKEKDEQLAEALTAVRKYPEYRQQSIRIQELLESEIQELRRMQKENMDRLIQIEEQNKRRECNKLRDTLLQHYRYYTNKEMNPSQSWTRMESDAFWELFADYEEMGGDGYIHTEVQPAMERLIVKEIGGH